MKKIGGKIKVDRNPGRGEGEMSGTGVPVQIIYYVIDKIFELFKRRPKKGDE